jgi:glyoxylase-like metal-dependent hydrolase (beta-lactamase superfamily II)/8-oxo-dGTP pyrophosphatase MutT (NUDIX family)
MDWFAHKDVTPRPAAAAIILSDDTPSEILLARRNDKLPFMGGHHVFPGGRIDQEDHSAFVDGDYDRGEKDAIFAAAREVFEETGLLCVSGSLPAMEELRAAREALLKKARTFPEILEDFGRHVDGEHFTPAGLWITPPFSPIRYLTRYFIYHHTGPRYEEVEEGDAEIVGLDWLTAQEARRRWHRKELKLSTPVAFVLHHLAKLPWKDALPWLHKTPGHNYDKPNRFELRRGIHLIPVRTATLPPATHTNCVVVGEEDLYLIDPGAVEDSERAHLQDHIDHLVAVGGTLRGVVLSHSHPDHTAAAVHFRALYDVPILAHAETDRQVDFPIDRYLEDEEVIVVPGDPDWRVRCVHTPGHDPGHLCFVEETTQTLLCGDMAANPGTIIISPEYGGDMDEYLDSLERLIADGVYNFMIPGHGMPFWKQDSREVLRGLIAHRIGREEKIKAALDAGARTPEEIIEKAYDDTPQEAWPLAAHQLKAHLKRLGVTLES